MKKEYLTPSLEIYKALTNQVICTSAGDIEDGIGFGDVVEE